MTIKDNKPFAEIIESSLHQWLAQSWQWDNFPTFGSLIAVEQKERTHIGIVCQVKTGSMDPMRYPFPYQKTEAELLEEQPQIFEFLKTTFTCISLGYYEKGKMRYSLAPKPPKIHAFVTALPADLSKQFLSSRHLLHTIFSQAHDIPNIDELLVALLDHHHHLSPLDPEKIRPFMQTYSLLIGNDYRRTKLFLQRVQQLID